MMVELMKPTPKETICDPACGTGGFLVGASDYLRETYRNDILMNKENRDHYMNHMFYGFDYGQNYASYWCYEYDDSWCRVSIH